MIDSMKMRQNLKYRIVYCTVLIVCIYIILKPVFFQSVEDRGCTVVETPPDDAVAVTVSMNQIMIGEPIKLEQDDPRIIDYIWAKKHLEPPSEKPYNLKENTSEDPSRGQAQLIRKILKNMHGGFFVEGGGLDGETRSNTLVMERNFGWKGLLVEGDPSNYEKMKLKNRKAWISNTCLSIKDYPHHARFTQKFNQGKIVPENGVQLSKTIEVQCMPLFSLLTALNVTTVDYFSLDVEGSELQVLRTIPFEKLEIKTLSVEYIHTSEGKDELLNFMESKGYKLYGEVHYPNNLANDLIFVHKSLSL